MPQGNSDHRFLSTLSHDLRGGLHSVQLALDMLRRDVLDNQPMEQTLGDVELARRWLMDSGARAERIICARRLQMSAMPLRIAEVDVVPAVLQAVRVSVAADEGAGERVQLEAPPQVTIRSDARLVGEIVGGLLDHALRVVRDVTLRLRLDTGGLLEVTADRPWITGNAMAVISVATNDPPFAEPTLGLYVAAAAARLLGTGLHCTSDRKIEVTFATGLPIFQA